MSTTDSPAEQAAEPRFAFDNSYARALDGFYVPWQPRPAPAPRLLRLNRELADELGLDAEALAGPHGLAMLSGQRVPDGAEPLAQAYAGHQFGGYSPQLGDGRALLLGELIDRNGRRRDIAFKGSGRTPFSRGGDGKAVLGPVLREYLIGEAMQAFGIPTTRALAALATGETVMRDAPLPGALLVRVAASHLRVGTFQFVAAQRDPDAIRRLADYSINRHYPDLADADDRYLALLRAVSERQAALIAQWMGVGFIHGVMNTDNMTISGETIDYGPCAFLEAYDPQTVFSSIDAQGRYAFGNQPAIAQWNLARFAETLLALIDDSADRAVERASEVVNAFPAHYQQQALAVMRAKLGLDDGADAAADQSLAEDFLGLLQRRDVDFTLAFRRLGDAAAGNDAPLTALFPAADSAPADWLARWRQRSAAAGIDGDEQAAAMARVNPIYIPRNHLVEAALSAAVADDDLAPFERLLAVARRPFDERDADAAFAEPAAPEQTAGYRTFCGT
ncbi:protein adenylyltransferase SelO [Piscinibacter sakaiensis]|uniref:protein adenylyltransferase SelO n=1 Tax=Piscinibacter sakaiensis TaxID=1547922 RepID=UPI003AAF49BC